MQFAVEQNNTDCFVKLELLLFKKFCEIGVPIKITWNHLLYKFKYQMTQIQIACP